MQTVDYVWVSLTLIDQLLAMKAVQKWTVTVDGLAPGALLEVA